MLDIIKDGRIESSDQVLEIARTCERVVIPSEDDVDVSHWWIIRDNGAQTLYIGTPETFGSYVKEQNGGVH